MAVHKTFPATAAEKPDTAEKEQPAVEVIAALVPWANREERLLSLLHSVAAHAQKQEPNCTRYLIYVHPSTSPSSNLNIAGGLEIQNTRLKGSKIEIVERYSTPGAFEEHTQSQPFRMLVQALGAEGLLSESPGRMEEGRVQCVGGFE
ncbi:MAG: hypothetical protein Q9207_001945 [Kuettlingeria erythrocarpa]